MLWLYSFGAAVWVCAILTIIVVHKDEWWWTKND